MLVVPAQLRGARTGRNLNRGYDGGTIEEIVQHQQRVGHHQQGIRHFPIVRWGIGQTLQGTYDVVPQISHGAAGESWQTRNLDRRMLPHSAAQMFQWRDVGFHDGPAGVAGPARTLPAAIAVDLAWVRCQKRVARPPLAAFE
jgi:hypothetical protein